jgi:hypothetical protein
MVVRIILEVNERRQVFSFDELGNSFLDAIRIVIRDEIERVLASCIASQSAKDPEPNRPVALSKSKAAHALGVSVCTLDNCIAQKESAFYALAGAFWFPCTASRLLSNAELSKHTAIIRRCRNNGLACFAEVLHQHIRMACRVDAVGVSRAPFENFLHLLE